MIARTHDTAAITLLCIVFVAAPPVSLSVSTAILAITAALVGGIAPDIDQPTAPLWRNLPIGKYFGRIFGSLIGGHRFLSHSLIGVALFAYLFHSALMFLQPVMTSVNIGLVTWAFIIGILSHLIMDTLTKEGVPWLLPIPFKFGWPPIRAWRITTDKWIETRIIFPLLILANVTFLFVYYDSIAYFITHNITR